MTDFKIAEYKGDPMGAAIYDYYENGHAGVLKVYSSDFDEDEIPVADLFRSKDEMPELEQIALDLADGDILDVGGSIFIFFEHKELIEKLRN